MRSCCSRKAILLIHVWGTESDLCWLVDDNDRFFRMWWRVVVFHCWIRCLLLTWVSVQVGHTFTTQFFFAWSQNTGTSCTPHTPKIFCYLFILGVLHVIAHLPGFTPAISFPVLPAYNMFVHSTWSSLKHCYLFGVLHTVISEQTGIFSSTTEKLRSQINFILWVECKIYWSLHSWTPFGGMWSLSLNMLN
jgi:hypothetical protein